MNSQLSLIIVGLGGSLIGALASIIVAKINATNQKPLENVQALSNTVDTLVKERELMKEQISNLRLEVNDLKEQREKDQDEIHDLHAIIGMNVVEIISDFQKVLHDLKVVLSKLKSEEFKGA